jgi:hypothetical protein
MLTAFVSTTSIRIIYVSTTFVYIICSFTIHELCEQIFVHRLCAYFSGHYLWEQICFHLNFWNAKLSVQILIENPWEFFVYGFACGNEKICSARKGNGEYAELQKRVGKVWEAGKGKSILMRTRILLPEKKIMVLSKIGCWNSLPTSARWLARLPLQPWSLPLWWPDICWPVTSQTILSGWPDGMTGLALSLTEHTVDLTGLAVLLL